MCWLTTTKPSQHERQDPQSPLIIIRTAQTRPQSLYSPQSRKTKEKCLSQGHTTKSPHTVDSKTYSLASLQLNLCANLAPKGYLRLRYSNNQNKKKALNGSNFKTFGNVKYIDYTQIG